MLAAATAAWLASFAVLARVGTWITFAAAGVVLVVGAVATGAVPRALLRPSVIRVAVGLVVGLAMIALTRTAYLLVTPLVPAASAGSVRLFRLLNVAGWSPAARGALIVVVATCEEILFRGALPGPASRSAGWKLHRLQRRDVVVVAVFAAGYALATLSLGSALLVLCAFACGVVWGVMRIATRSLVPPVVAHVVWDLGVLVVWPVVGTA